MLTKLLPEQIAAFWEIIKYAIEQSVPPIAGEHPDRMNRLLMAALSGKIDIWAAYVKGEKEAKFEGIAVTEVLYDEATRSKNLLLYSMYGYTESESVTATYVQGLEALTKYAHGLGCSHIIAYTQQSKIISLSKRLGADTSYTLISFDVGKMVQKLNDLGG